MAALTREPGDLPSLTMNAGRGAPVEDVTVADNGQFPGFQKAPRVLVLGGARSGKSRFAEVLAENTQLEKIYVATAEARDGEMVSRIKEHQDRRGTGWRTVEEPIDLAGTIRQWASPNCVLLIDCLTLWATNLMFSEGGGTEGEEALYDVLADYSYPIIFVSNEVGLGIVPENKLAREFRDRAGRINQEIAKRADAVYFIAAGLPLTLKSPATENRQPW